MDLLTLALLIVAVYTVYHYFKNQLSYFEKRGVPYVPGWPLFGNMVDAFLRREHVSDTITKLYKSHPEAKYVGAFDFVRPVLLLRDLELIKSITIKNFDNFPDHKPFIDGNPVIGANLFNVTGDRWKELRNLLSPAFTCSKMKIMHELLVVCAQNFTNYLSKLSSSQRKMVQIKELFTRYTNDAIATTAFGVNVNSFEDPTNEFYVFGKEATNLEKILVKFFISRSFPAIMKWFKISFVPEHVLKFFKNFVDTTVKMRDSKGISRPDMIQLMMNARGKTSKNLKLDLTEMTAQAFLFFFGAFDTTSTQMCIIAHQLAIYPEIQRRLQKEIDEVMTKSDGNPSYEDIQGMLYLDAVFNESMRRHTQAATFDRLCVKDFELPPALPGGKPFTLEPGMNVWIPVTGIHMDPRYYDNPEKLDPDRYYEKKVTINDVTNLGFGIGPRSCIGNRFAIYETKILFVYALSKFNLRPTAKTNNPLKYSRNTFTIADEGGYWLECEPRITN